MMSAMLEWHTISVPHHGSYTTSELHVSRNATYGLQEALSTGGSPDWNYPNEDDETFHFHFALFNNTCPKPGCINACQGNFTTMFLNNGLQTLHNCFILPYLATRDPQGNTSVAAVSSVYPLGTDFTIAAINATNTLLGKFLISRSYLELPLTSKPRLSEGCL